MKVALDAMGGDFAPLEPVKGAVEAINELSDIEVVLVGNKLEIEKELSKYNYDKSRIEILHTDEKILMHEDQPPAMAVRKKKNASMILALELVKKGEAVACVSAGNTGALMTASQLILKRIRGVLRPAITTVFPNKKGSMVLLDAGANADCKPEYLNQFALMGAKYAEILFGKEKPKVALLNIGEEEGKGNELVKNTFEILKENKKINFSGNIEAREMMDGNVDVIVADGFTGNVILKTGEGVATLILDLLKTGIKSKFIYKLGALILKPVFVQLKNKIDSTEYGGALFLGLNGISIKAHGNSDSKAIKNALNVAHKFGKSNFVEELKNTMSEEA
jgi:glycerol-3-phosphate acyltransferase PlsX